MIPTRLVIIGDPVAQTRSPQLQGAAIAAAGLAVRYEAMRVPAADLETVARQLTDEGAGGNVTVPHKIAFSAYCAERTPAAVRTGAVNTFWTVDGKLFGDNTDVGGFDAAARELLGAIPAGLRVALIGAGGAAAAVLGAVEQWQGATVTIHSRNPASSAALAERFDAFASVNSTALEALRDANLVVNATPVGMTDDSTPFPIEALAPDSAVLDLVYRTGGTALTRLAAVAGHRAADGTTMLIEQGARAFERWFGFPPDKKVMRAALA